MVQYVRGNFFAGEEFLDLADAQARAETWCRDKAGQRVHGTIQARPVEVFAAHEAAALLPEPQAPYEVPLYVEVTVHRDYHVQVGKALYSAPKAYLGQRVQVRADAELVKLFCHGQLIKTHPRQRPGGRSTDPDDLPADKAGYAMRDLQRLIRAAAAHGDNVGIYADRLLDDKLPWMDPDAAGLPAARPGQTLRQRLDRHRLRPGAGVRCGVRVQDRLDARARDGEHPATRAPGRAGRRPGPLRPRPAGVPARQAVLDEGHRRRSGGPIMSTTVVTDPVSPELKQVLRQLKLAKMLDTLRERIVLAKQQHLTHAAFLELVLADEATRRDTQSAQLRARKAGLDPGMRLETWDETATVRYDRALWTELTSLRFLDGPDGACLLGPEVICGSIFKLRCLRRSGCCCD
ncbi:Mu transposase domain-containing protein [Saccharopolyspora hattusasensis]|uniref:Mu transposase domain-containing protein n=1 Tax=Saccharopolyspora hattusasensis TaxID=1128679 RepID=UPI003D98FABA